MAETEQKLADCVGAIYEAVTGTQSWQPVDSQLGEIMDAQSVLLNLVAENGNVDSLMPIGEADAVYASYYHRIDPYVARARADYTDNRNFHIGRALPARRSFLTEPSSEANITMTSRAATNADI